MMPLRLVIGVIMAAHGAQKAFGWFGGGGFQGFSQYLGDALGFPAPALFAVLAILAELVGGLMLIAGFMPRPASLAIGVVMIVALATAHRGDSFFKTHAQQVILAGCVTLLVAGSGPLSLQRSAPRREREEAPGAEPSVEREDE
jgi:putative oxidoreductase